MLDGRGSGPYNMGVDEALLETAIRAGLPTLRFYTWRGPWLSLGYGQRESALDGGPSASQRPAVVDNTGTNRAGGGGAPESRLAILAGEGGGMVRRSTGGRAVLHGCDLTYSLAAPAEYLPAGLRPAYLLIASALAGALARLGVAVEREPLKRSAGREARFDCFAFPAQDELCVGGQKLVGNAQRRTRAGVLQHGSIRMAPETDRVRALLGLEGGVATSLAEQGCKASEEDLRGACIASFREALCADFEEHGLEGHELLRARSRGFEPLPEVPAAGPSAASYVRGSFPSC